jgi:glycosyltransferase involved in cell wall biosynthesis
MKLSGSHWKWRMHGGAVTLARRFNESDAAPDLLLATDMLDVTTFLALTRERTAGVPLATYFHENQLTYPWSPIDRDRLRDRDKHYSFINFAAALASDRVFFNSRYHLESFMGELPRFLKQFPDHQELDQVERIRQKSRVLPLGLSLQRLDAARPQEALAAKRPPLVLWNHRWEYDKNPDEFFEALRIVATRGRDFEVAVLGESFDVIPDAFTQAREILGDRLVHYGYAEDRAQYDRWLWRADILPVTSHQDFFGGSVMEAIYCGCFPLLPNRLAYPELIPRELYPTHFYRDFDELVEKLDAAVQHIATTRETTLQAVAETYDWQRMAGVYDTAFDELVR